MGDWTPYLHERISRIERSLWGDGEATRIAEAAPEYNAVTESLVTGQSPSFEVVQVPGPGQSAQIVPTTAAQGPTGPTVPPSDAPADAPAEPVPGPNPLAPPTA